MCHLVNNAIFYCIERGSKISGHHKPKKTAVKKHWKFHCQESVALWTFLVAKDGLLFAHWMLILKISAGFVCKYIYMWKSDAIFCDLCEPWTYRPSMSSVMLRIHFKAARPYCFVINVRFWVKFNDNDGGIWNWH